MKQELELSEQLIDEGFTPFGEISELTKEQILDKEIFEHIFSIDNQIARTTLIIRLQDKARELGNIRNLHKDLNKEVAIQFNSRSHQLKN